MLNLKKWCETQQYSLKQFSYLTSNDLMMYLPNNTLGGTPFTSKYIMLRYYGYLFGVIRAIEDTHRDEDFIERNGHIIARNGRQLCTYTELVDIARSLGVNPWQLTLIDYEEI